MRPLVHVGYHKTATTWLQDELFGRPGTGFVLALDRGAIANLLTRPRPLAFDEAMVTRELNAACRRASDGRSVPVISAERLSGSPQTGGYDTVTIAERLQLVLPNARILVMIREQRDMIVAAYRQYVRDGGTASLGSWLHPPAAARVPLFDFEFFAYHRYIQLLRHLFDPEDVLVVAYEQFRADPQGVVRRLRALTGAPFGTEPGYELRRNRSLTPTAVGIKRRVNRLGAVDPLSPHRGVTFGPARWLEGLLRTRSLPSFRQLDAPLDRRARAVVERHVGTRYGDSNRVTSEIIGVDLGRLGYHMN